MKIKQLIPLTIACAAALLAFHHGSASATQARAEEILRKVDDMWRGKSSRAGIVMKVKTANYTRTLSLDAWSKGKEMTLVRIVSPLKEKGTATLKTGNEIYTYLPKTDRTIKLSSGMMMGSWMGSHFTNDDLVKESRLTDDYDTTITFEGTRQGKNMMEFTLIPKPDAAVVWGKIILLLYVDGDDYVPVKEEYFDEDGAPVRTMAFSDVKIFSGRKIPAILRVTPVGKPGEFTELIYGSLDFNLDINDSFFSLSQLRR